MIGANKARKPRDSFKPRAIDRVMFAVLSGVMVLSGGYLVGPWYIPGDADGKAPLYNLFGNTHVVSTFGYTIIVVGAMLAYSACANPAQRYYTTITSTALFAGFLLRLYSLVGVFLTLNSWRPPSYLSHLATVVMLGSYWIWVRVSARPTE